MTAHSPLHFYEQVVLFALRSEEGTSMIGLEHIAIAGAVLAEWLIDGRISVDQTRKQLVSLNKTRHTGDPVFDECLGLFAAARKPAPLRTWIARLSRIPRLRHKAAMQLCARGILRADEDKVLWFFTRKIYPQVDPKPRRAMLEKVWSVIDSESAKVDEHLAVLISLAHGAGLLTCVFGRAEVRQRKLRIAAVIDGNTVGKATQQLIATYRAIAAASGASTAVVAARG
jgi:golgi phosphoprotein 3